jgi:putative oxidoreductase
MTDNSLAGRWVSWAPYFLSLLRIILGFLFVQHGGTKILGWPAAVMPGGGTAPLMSQAGVAGVVELCGGALLLVGLFTRPVAFLLSGLMAFAYFLGHAGEGFWPVLNNGALAVIYCFVCLYISAAGGGPWSLDASMRRR